jgi:hypothetical protein
MTLSISQDKICGRNLLWPNLRYSRRLFEGLRIIYYVRQRYLVTFITHLLLSHEINYYVLSNVNKQGQRNEAASKEHIEMSKIPHKNIL